ncbi:Holliday junction endonuclease [Jiangella asiatica]|uniref:Holliday junction endonuclease n=1 Tax=Jiangella asiatica TaxID=2530372 RepID=A0A4R5CZW1_9ACTN|nr:Holliday junction endonuclease [Jiangella asiatica]TDE03443.1 Holliday junction endonuclease [Jiangella asiatica]
MSIDEWTAVVGIDPSMTGTGLAYGHDLLDTVTFSRKVAGDQRLAHIDGAIAGAVRGAGLAIIEDLPTHGHGAGITGMAQGVIRLALIRAMVPYVTVPPATLKKYATGRGNATKADMRMALYQRTDLDVRDDNQVDAWWLRQMGRDAIGHHYAVKLPRAQREAMLKLTWPEEVAARLLEPYERLVRDTELPGATP